MLLQPMRRPRCLSGPIPKNLVSRGCSPIASMPSLPYLEDSRGAETPNPDVSMADKGHERSQPEQDALEDVVDVPKPDQELTQDEELAIALQNYVPDTPEEKRLVRKIDFVLLPCLWWMYVLAYLDRGNIANANAAGMSEELKMNDKDYSLLVYLFFVGYFLYEVPSNIIINKCRPSLYLPTIIWVWGCVVLGLSQAKNYEGFLAGRFFLGCIEAGLFPGAIFLLTCWYTKKEIGKRFCIFYTSGCIAPALGGIMAGAIIDGLEGARGIPGWRWLLIVEGVLTVVCGFGLYFIIPDYPQNARYFTPEQRRLASVRILFDRQLTVSVTTRRMTSWQAFKAVVLDGKTWFFLVSYSIIIMGMSISYFVPSILRNMGYTSVTAQWMTVPIWITGAVCQLALSWTSDKAQDRRWHTVGLFALSAAACLMSAFVKPAVAKYVMMCCLVAGLYTGLPLMLNWTSECIPFPDQKRSIAIAFVNSFGHLAIIYGSYLWPSTNAPQHLLGFTTLTAACGGGALLAIAAPWIFKLLPKEPATKAERDIFALQGQPTVFDDTANAQKS
ncbi:major facilitator superfamily transporter [Fusarium albosuccineum]|uniref:Major facilitator superfamily transporter n=1 Tax=Fusarium albosuccineum TaxID=1237068 RepID=A0A8H4LPF8_9HYPO|nr:major facilitator superfamily transporter [Fusarium albosuccineum]